VTRHVSLADYPRFHLAFPVTDLAEARIFYGGFQGCAEGRSSSDRVEFDVFGNALECKAFADPAQPFPT